MKTKLEKVKVFSHLSCIMGGETHNYSPEEIKGNTIFGTLGHVGGIQSDFL